ncbi:MtrB/PioB family decaheme-associated outer membrane protein [Piscinibacter sp.]|uniref:MtrB/PioB family decaheme-associated outer membrane protein n=1 Tax=Piscinibacter sp. TaxID=1903157 RepID=UPI002C3D1CE8|nr:MtrB/PioB family decaheme-associated outer membrane protein [Albitalea sp.]HUG22389.1 MtrB/PioB family decaheme-associated outer membrane protein [Albitalea sp.]
MRPFAAPHDIRPTLLALAVFAAFGGAGAQETPAQGSVSFGIGLVGGDRALFGQYNGLRTHRAVGLLGAEYDRHDGASGRSTQFRAAHLLGDTRELDFRWKKQGDWSFSAAYGEQVRHEPLSVSSGVDLSIARTHLGLGLAKILGARLRLDMSLKTENKDGSRLFGIGMSCPSAVAPGCRPTTGTETGWALLMLPEPIDANHSQVETRLSYAGDKLRLSGGYYGSFYRNAHGSLVPTVPATLNNPLGTPLPLSAGLHDILSQPVALPPDNQAHHLDIAGNYAFTPKTRLNFKLGIARALQSQDFTAAGLTGAPAGVADLGGRVDTRLAHLGLTSRPSAKLSLLAKLRYEDRDDRTPIAAYNVEDASTYTNRHLPSTRLRGQLQASYQFSADYRGTLGADRESIDRGVFTATSAVAGISALRQKTDETTVRAELRRRMNEDISGAIGIASSRRDGSNWLRNNSGLGVTEVPDPADPATGFSTAIFMPTLADRRRDTVKLSADWQPTDELALQLNAQRGRDSFDTPSAYGLRRAGMDQVGIDASYAWSSRWSVNGHIAHSEETLRQARPAAAETSFTNRSTSLGLGVTGKPVAKLDVGASLGLVDDKSVHRQTLDPTAPASDAALLAATGGLPDIVFRQTTLKLFGRYALDDRSALRLDLVHQRSKWTDWAWAYYGVPFVYSDGTVVSRQPFQIAGFIGLVYTISWR